VTENVRERHRLNDADPARLRDRGDELGVAARVHCPADDRKPNAGLGREASGVCQRHREPEFMSESSRENAVENDVMKNFSIDAISVTMSSLE
jgi:hypothetical protein